MCITVCVWEGDREGNTVTARGPVQRHFTDEAVFNLTQNPNSSTAL